MRRENDAIGLRSGKPRHYAPLALLVCLMSSAAFGAFQEREHDSERRARFNQRQRDESDPFSAQYAVVVENNIFLRDRRQRQATTTFATTQIAPPPNPLKEFVLVGVVFEEGEFRAYFENLKGGGMTRAVVGDALASGSLGEVFIDAIGFSTDEGLRWIEIGQDLTGEYVVIPGAERPAATASTPATGGAPAGGSPNTGTMSIEERLRQRRLQETGGARPGGVPGAQQAVPLQGGELPPGAIMQGEVIIVPDGQVAPGGEVDVVWVPAGQVPPPTDQPQRAPPPADQPQRRPG